MMAGPEVFGRVPVFGIVAAADVAAGATQAKMHPCITHRQAFLAAFGIRRARYDEL
jgi:hypothetical protein